VGKNSFMPGFKKIPASIMGAVILFIALEIAARLFYTPRYIGEDLYVKTTPFYSRGYDNLPLCYQKAGRFYVWRTQYWDVNPQSFSVKKPGDEFRIFIFGDCNMHFGSAAFFLEDILNSLGANKKFKVINLAHNGWGMGLNLRTLKKSLGYKPDVVLFPVSWEHTYSDREYFDEYRNVHQFPRGIVLRSYVVCIVKKLQRIYLADRIPKRQEEEAPLKSFLQEIRQVKGAYSDEVLERLLTLHARTPILGHVCYGFFERYRRSQADKAQLLEKIRSNVQELVAVTRDNKIPVIAMFPAWHTAPDVPLGGDMFEKFEPIPDINAVVLPGLPSQGLFVFRASQAFYENLHVFNTKYLPLPNLEGAWTARSGLVLARALAQVILADILRSPAVDRIPDFHNLEKKYLSTLEAESAMIDIDFILRLMDYYNTSRDLDIIKVFRYYIDKNRDILARGGNVEVSRTPRRTIDSQDAAYWLDFLEGWVRSREGIQQIILKKDGR